MPKAQDAAGPLRTPPMTDMERILHVQPPGWCDGVTLKALCGCGNDGDGFGPPLVVAPPVRPRSEDKANAYDDGPAKEAEWEHFIVTNDAKPPRKSHRSKAKKTATGMSFDHEASVRESMEFIRRDKKKEPERPQRSSMSGPEKTEAADAKRSQSETFLEVVCMVRECRMKELAEVIAKMPSIVSEADKYRQTLLFWAATSESTALVQILLESRSAANARNNNGYSPLMRALCHGNVDAASLILKAHGDIMATDAFGGTALSIACGAGQVGSIEWILGRKQTTQALLVMHDEEGCAPLLVAARSGQTAACSALLKAMAQADAADDHGRTPLLFALARNDVDLAAVLLEKEADVNVTDEKGKSLVICLAENAIKHPKHRNDSIFGLVTAFEAGGDPDSQDEQGATGLLLASKARDALLVTLFATYGADPSIPDEKEVTALMFARSKGYTDICCVLRDLGAMDGAVRGNPMARFNRSFLRAVYYGHVKSCRTLLQRSADLEATSRKGTPISEYVKRSTQNDIKQVVKQFQEDRSRTLDESLEKTVGQAEAVQACHKNLASLRERGGRLQRFVADLNLDGVSELTIGIVKAGTPKVEPAHTDAVRLLNNLCGLWHDKQVETGLKEMRRIRSLRRTTLLVEFREKLIDWNANTNLQDEKILRQSAVACIMGVNSYAMKEDEASDATTVTCEEIQVRVLKAIANWISDLPQVVATEFQTLPMGPEKVRDILDREFAANRCAKCFQVFKYPETLAAHVELCNSRDGALRKQELHEKRKEQAEIYTMRLISVASDYTKFDRKGRSIAIMLKECREQSRKQRDVRDVIEACATLIDAVTKICADRSAFCLKHAWVFVREYPKFADLFPHEQEEEESEDEDDDMVPIVG